MLPPSTPPSSSSWVRWKTKLLQAAEIIRASLRKPPEKPFSLLSIEIKPFCYDLFRPKLNYLCRVTFHISFPVCSFPFFPGLSQNKSSPLFNGPATSPVLLFPTLNRAGLPLLFLPPGKSNSSPFPPLYPNGAEVYVEQPLNTR